MFGFRKRRRARLRRQPLPAAWREIVERNAPYAALLSAAERRQLEGLIQIFLAEKRFEGCGGLAIDDEIRVTIAAHACILLLNRETDVYPGLATILVYPHAYVARAVTRTPAGVVVEEPQVRAGQSWSQGSLVLSWDDVLRGALDVDDGHNVVFHEFAHQLDDESGRGDGAPRLPSRARYGAWARVLGREYADLLDAVARHRPTLLDPYAAVGPAEFFAVATECFFEQPLALRRRHPELYAELAAFYCQDPALRAQGA